MTMRIWIFVAFILFGWAAQAAEVKAVSGLDINRYLGTWHEVARYPFFFQRGCTQSKAEYVKLAKDRISVVNTCRRSGRIVTAKGDAIVSGPGKLRVAFSKLLPIRADYWVLYIDKTYSTAVVGSPNRRVGWILSRSQNRSHKSLEPALAALRRNGYDLSRLEFERQ